MTLQRSAKLNPILHNLAASISGEMKRSNHPDFATTTELKAKEWSGLRHNSLSMEYEFWVVGEIKARVSDMTVASEPFALEKAHSLLFGIGLPK